MNPIYQCNTHSKRVISLKNSVRFVLEIYTSRVFYYKCISFTKKFLLAGKIITSVQIHFIILSTFLLLENVIASVRTMKHIYQCISNSKAIHRLQKIRFVFYSKFI